MPAFRTIQARYTLFLVLFILLLSVLTVVGISQLVAPKLRHTEEQVVLNRIAEVAEQIQGELNKVQAQQRSITQTIPLLDSAAIDTVLPGLVDQYGELKVFGGGIWPLPGQREAGTQQVQHLLAPRCLGQTGGEHVLEQRRRAQLLRPELVQGRHGHPARSVRLGRRLQGRRQRRAAHQLRHGHPEKRRRRGACRPST